MKALLTLISFLLLAALAIGSYYTPTANLQTLLQPAERVTQPELAATNTVHAPVDKNQTSADFVQLQIEITPEILAKANAIYALAMARQPVPAASTTPSALPVRQPDQARQASELSRLTAENQRLYEAIQRSKP